MSIRDLAPDADPRSTASIDKCTGRASRRLAPRFSRSAFSHPSSTTMRNPLLLWAATLALALQLVGALPLLNDYWNHFCGPKHNCYDVLGVAEDANTTTIRTAYRKLSLHWHPDKNKSPEAPAQFQLIAKAYQTLMNETHRELYHRFIEHPDEYWVEYGHYFYSKYAPKTDTVFAIVLLLVVFSIFGPFAQRSKYQHACSFLITAAVKGWSLREGGTKETLEIRRRALEQVRAKKENCTNNGNGAPTGSGKKKDKSDKRKVKEDEDPEFIQAVKDIVYAMEIKGGYRNWEWNDVLVVKLARLPVWLGQALYFQAKWWYDHSYCGKPLTPEEEEYLTRKLVGELRWEMLDEGEGDKEDLIAHKLWLPENREDFDFAEWKEKRDMARMNPMQLKKYLKDKKRRQQMEAEEEDEYDE